MQVTIRDRGALESVPVLSVRAYLHSRGWVNDGPWGRRKLATLYLKEQGEKTWDLVVPNLDTVTDYARRIGEIVETIAEAEDRPQLDVFYDLKNAGGDIIRLTARNGKSRQEMSLKDSADLLNDAYDMLAAAARSVENPQAVHRGRISSDVAAYLDAVRPLPHQFDSYALALHSPAPVGVGPQQDMGDEYHVPFARRATLQLREALQSTIEAVGEAISGDTLEPFQRAVSAGVSANLCSSVAGLAEHGHGIEISLNWAQTRPATVPSNLYPFSANSAGILRDAAADFRRNEPSPAELITGHIAKLERDQPDEFDGRATILSVRDDRLVRIQVEFAEPDFIKVIQAFRDLSRISVIGDVYREGNAFVLRNPRNLGSQE